jgi:hypothetical protein
LSLWGLALFAAVTYHAVRFNRQMHPGHSSRYFWWGPARLDSEPLNEPPLNVQPCAQETADCIEWDTDYIWVDSGLFAKALVVSAIPAFLLDFAIVRGLAHLGVSEVTTFMVTTPVCITFWFYSVGRLLDRWGYKRRTRLAARSS